MEHGVHGMLGAHAQHHVVVEDQKIAQETLPVGSHVMVTQQTHKFAQVRPSINLWLFIWAMITLTLGKQRMNRSARIPSSASRMRNAMIIVLIMLNTGERMSSLTLGIIMDPQKVPQIIGWVNQTYFRKSYASASVVLRRSHQWNWETALLNQDGI